MLGGSSRTATTNLHRSPDERQVLAGWFGQSGAIRVVDRLRAVANVGLGEGMLRSVASVFPVEHLAAALHLAAVRGSFTTAVSATDLLVLGLWALIAAAFAAWRFSWLPSAATA